MASLLAAGAGASEGLDTMLTRMLQQQQADQRGRALDEESRHNQATEGQARDTLASMQGERDALAEQRGQVTEDRRRADAAETRRVAEEDKLLSDPNTPSVLKNFLSTRRATPKGENVPAQLFTEPVRGTNEMKTFVINDPTVAKKYGATVGKPFDAPFNSGTSKVKIAGQDLDVGPGSGIDHFEHPQPTDRTLVPTDQGYMTRADVEAILKKGGHVAQPDTAQQRSRQDLAGRVSSHFEDIQGMLDDAEKRGLLGPLKGRTFNEFMAGKVGSTGNASDDDALGELRQNLSLARSGLAQLHGRGGANAGIAQSLEKNMDAGFMSYPELTGSLRAMKNWVDTYAAKKPSSTTGAETTAPAGDAYAEYLARHKK